MIRANVRGSRPSFLGGAAIFSNRAWKTNSSTACEECQIYSELSFVPIPALLKFGAEACYHGACKGPLEVEKKAVRDARYAARKKRTKGFS